MEMSSEQTEIFCKKKNQLSITMYSKKIYTFKWLYITTIITKLINHSWCWSSGIILVCTNFKIIMVNAHFTPTDCFFSNMSKMVPRSPTSFACYMCVSNWKMSGRRTHGRFAMPEKLFPAMHLESNHNIINDSHEKKIKFWHSKKNYRPEQLPWAQSHQSHISTGQNTSATLTHTSESYLGDRIRIYND